MSPDEAQQQTQLSVAVFLIELIRFSLGPLVVLLMIRQLSHRWGGGYARHEWFAPVLGALFWGVLMNLTLFAPPPEALPL
jgi:hypothetical protein